MGPPNKKKAQVSKKASQKQKEKQIDDKTFGLKNKNKSKKVQQQISSIQRNILNSGDPKQRKLDEQRRSAKAGAKARKEAANKERDALFGDALLAVKKKTSTKTKSTVEAIGRDVAEEGKKSGTSHAMKLMYQMDAKEAEEKLASDPSYVRTLEDELESQRQAKLLELEKSGKKGTPITEETFKKWLNAKKLKRMQLAKKQVEAEMRKKKGGKGLSILSGRDLYLYNQNLFVDDVTFDSSEEQTQINKECLNGSESNSSMIESCVEKLNTQLFLQEDDEDLDDLDDE